MRRSFSMFGAALLVLAGITMPARFMAAGKAEILWDRYGVPHIFAADRESMFYAHGWAQMQAQANLLLRLYGESRGRAAEYWGPSRVELDRWVQLNGVPERAQGVVRRADADLPHLHGRVRARHQRLRARRIPSRLDTRTGSSCRSPASTSSATRCARCTTATWRSLDRMRSEVNAFRSRRRRRTVATGAAAAQRRMSTASELAAGSNTWTIGPPHSASGNAMLLINPHLAWGDTFYRYMEVHLVGPNYDLYGAPQIGFPVPVVGFNRHAGWGRTVNTIDTVDFFKLTVKDGQYLLRRSRCGTFEHAKQDAQDQAAGRLDEGGDGGDPPDRSRAGRVTTKRGLTVAMRVAGIDRPKMLEQWFKMGEATDARAVQGRPAHDGGADVERELRRRPGPHHAGLQRPGPEAQRARLRLLVRCRAGRHVGDAVDRLPDVRRAAEVDRSAERAGTRTPTSRPGMSTLPPLDRTKYAAVRRADGRAQPQMRVLRSLRMITEDPKISYEQLIAKKHSTRMELADKVLPDLLKAAGGKTEAARVLEKWDHRPTSTAAGRCSSRCSSTGTSRVPAASPRKCA